jgi:hypothetical protein
MKLLLYQEISEEAAAQRDGWAPDRETFTREGWEILAATKKWWEEQEVPSISPPEAYRRLVLELRRCP